VLFDAGMQEYLTLADILRLPKEDWVKSRRRIIRDLIHVGTMHGQFDLLAMTHNDEFYVAGADATRVIAKVEAEVTRRGLNHLSGPSFSPDPDDHKPMEELEPIPTSADALREKVERLHEAEQVAVNVELTALNCTTDPTRPTTVISAYPAARSGYTAIHRVKEWAYWRYYATHFRDHSARALMFIIFLVGAATDSCGAELAAGVYAGLPHEVEIDDGYRLLGLDDDDYLYFAKYFWFLPFAWYGDWDHALRTARRNLHNPRTCFAFGATCFATWGVIAAVKDMLGRRTNFLHRVLKFNLFMEQSSDDARKLIHHETIKAVEEVVENGRLPDGASTLLYLKMVNFMFNPMVEPNFGDPFDCARSMWTGLYLMRLWRAYVRLAPNITLGANFVSLEFYTTCECMIHGATNWYLIMFRHRGRVPWRRAAPLRLVADTRPQESIFSQTRVGRHAGNTVNVTFKVSALNWRHLNVSSAPRRLIVAAPSSRRHAANFWSPHVASLLPLAGVHGHTFPGRSELAREVEHAKSRCSRCTAEEQEGDVGNQSCRC